VDFIPTQYVRRSRSIRSRRPSPEEQNFGPVVGLTPPAHDFAVGVFGLPSGEASTVVFAPPSVAADDLDHEDEGDADTEQAGWNPIAEGRTQSAI
jgi:hypothetical protein